MASRAARRTDPLQVHDPWASACTAASASGASLAAKDDHCSRGDELLGSRDAELIKSVFLGLASGGASRQVVAAATAAALRSSSCSATPKHGGANLLETYEETISAAKEVDPSIQHIGDVLLNLRSGGHKNLAKTVKAMASSRHVAAHPCRNLPQQVRAALGRPCLATSAGDDSGAECTPFGSCHADGEQPSAARCGDPSAPLTSDVSTACGQALLFIGSVQEATAFAKSMGFGVPADSCPPMSTAPTSGSSYAAPHWSYPAWCFGNWTSCEAAVQTDAKPYDDIQSRHVHGNDSSISMTKIEYDQCYHKQRYHEQHDIQLAGSSPSPSPRPDATTLDLAGKFMRFCIPADAPDREPSTYVAEIVHVTRADARQLRLQIRYTKGARGEEVLCLDLDRDRLADGFDHVDMEYHILSKTELDALSDSEDDAYEDESAVENDEELCGG